LWQVPPLQCWPFGHFTPHPPQLPVLRCVLTHCGGEPHGVSPWPQPQEPPLQTMPPVHVMPQPPQLLGSDWMFTHAFAQFWRLPVQVGTQAPF